MNSVLAEPTTAYAALLNPALLSASPHSQFAFSTSVAHADYSARLSSLQKTLWTLGYVYPFSWNALQRRLGFGISLSGPYDYLRKFQAHRPDDAYSLRYGNADSQMKATLGLSGEILKDTLSFGAGLSLFLNGAGNAEATLAAENPTGRMALDVGLNAALVSGLYFHSGRTGAALVYTQEVNPEFVQRFDGKASIGGASTFHQPLVARSFLYYEPHSLELEGQYNFGPCLASVGVSYQWWNGYHSPILITSTVDSNQTPQTTHLPSLSLRNTVNPRFSLQVPFAEHRWIFSTGYQFRPTPLVDLSGTSQALDSDIHVFGVSLERTFAPHPFFPFSTRLGLFAQYHRLKEREVAQTTGTYRFSGDVYTYGISLILGQSNSSI